MGDTSSSEDLHSVKATEMGTIFWISIGLGTVASLPLLDGMANGSVSIARGAMWFLLTTLVAMVGVWTISWLMHVFSDPYPDDDLDEPAQTGDESASVSGGSSTFTADDRAATTNDAAAGSDAAGSGAAPAPAMSDAP